MSLQIGAALSRGFEKLTTTAGLQLAAMYVVLTLVSTVGINSVTVATVTDMPNPPALVLPTGVAGGGVLFLLGLLLNVVVSLVLLRTMAHERTNLRSIPSDATRSLLRGSVFLFVANVLVGIAVFIGFVALVIPGVFLFVSFIFTQVFVAVEDAGPIESMAASWRLSRGNRLSIFLLFLLLFVIAFVVGLVGIIPNIVSPLLGSIATILLTSVVNVFVVAVIVDAYLQLSAEATDEFDGDEATIPPA